MTIAPLLTVKLHTLQKNKVYFFKKKKNRVKMLIVNDLMTI